MNTKGLHVIFALILVPVSSHAGPPGLTLMTVKVEFGTTTLSGQMIFREMRKPDPEKGVVSPDEVPERQASLTYDSEHLHLYKSFKNVEHPRPMYVFWEEPQHIALKKVDRINLTPSNADKLVSFSEGIVRVDRKLVKLLEKRPVHQCDSKVTDYSTQTTWVSYNPAVTSKALEALCANGSAELDGSFGQAGQHPKFKDVYSFSFVRD